MSDTPLDKKESGYRMGYSKATTSSHASRTIHTDAAFVIPHVKPHHKVLDVGCGPGTITVGFADLVQPSAGGSVVGMDAGEPVVSSASALAASRGVSTDHLRFEQGDVLQGLPFADETFDVVFSSQTLTHIAAVPQALQEMRRVLKTGGLLATRDAAAYYYQPYTAELARFMERMYQAMGVSSLPTGSRMPEHFRASGWDVDDPQKTVFGGDATVVAGREKRLWWRDTIGGRLAKGEPFRQSWLEMGASDEEIDEHKAWIDKWAEDDNGWYAMLQSEVLAWK